MTPWYTSTKTATLYGGTVAPVQVEMESVRLSPHKPTIRKCKPPTIVARPSVARAVRPTRIAGPIASSRVRRVELSTTAAQTACPIAVPLERLPIRRTDVMAAVACVAPLIGLAEVL